MTERKVLNIKSGLVSGSETTFLKQIFIYLYFHLLGAFGSFLVYFVLFCFAPEEQSRGTRIDDILSCRVAQQ